MANKTLISVDELNKELINPNLIIIDCSFDLSDPTWGYKNYLNGHIPGAFFADLDKHLSSKVTLNSGRHPLPDEKQFISFCSLLGITFTSQVVLYDTVSGAFAGRLWWLLRSYGHSDVRLLDGGLKAWIDKGYPTDSDKPLSTSTDFEGKFSKKLLISTAEMEDIVNNNIYLIIDARSPARYSGEEEPIDAIAGRIPGAINIFHQENLDDNGLFKSPDSLRKIYRSAINEINPENVIVYCGSGVTSCLDLVALSVLGVDNARLYLGSWSEWIRNKAHPIISSPSNK